MEFFANSHIFQTFQNILPNNEPFLNNFEGANVVNQNNIWCSKSCGSNKKFACFIILFIIGIICFLI